MKLGRIISEYIETNGLSKRAFAEKCDISHTYINMLIDGKTKNGDVPIPSIQKLSQLAYGLDMSLSNLVTLTSDEDIAAVYTEAHEQELISIYRHLPTPYQSMLIDVARGMQRDTSKEVMP